MDCRTSFRRSIGCQGKLRRLWLQQGYLLPLLDGLDEVETVTQPDCVAAINAFIEESIKESTPLDSWFAVGSTSIAGYPNA